MVRKLANCRSRSPPNDYLACTATSHYTESDSNRLLGEYRAFTESIRKSGQLLASERLRPTDTATTIRSRNGKISTTDGPFAETKEQLGGFYMIEAKDLDEAIAVASRIPGTRSGSIGVRPIWELGS